MAIKANIIVDQGTDFYTAINLVDDDENILNLTGYTSNGQIRKTYTSSNAVNFGINLQTSNGIVELTLTKVQSANLVAGRYVYDVVLTNANVSSRIIEGVVTVTPRVTQ